MKNPMSDHGVFLVPTLRVGMHPVTLRITLWAYSGAG